MRPNRVAGPLAAVCAVLALAACGSSSNSSSGSTSSGGSTTSSGSSGTSYAQQQVAKYTGPADVGVAGQPFDAKKASGKTVWYIPLLTTVPAETSIISVMKQALAKVNVPLQVCDGKGGDPVASNGCVTQAVRQHAGGIIIDAIPGNILSASLNAAKSANIPTILGNDQDPSAPTPPNVSATVAYEYTLGAHLVADWVIADSQGKANSLVIDTNGLSLQKYVTFDGYKSEFATYCPQCKTTVASVASAGDWATKITPLVTSALTGNPDLDYVIPEYDAQVAFAGPAILQSGRGAKVKVATYNADLEQMQQLAKGQLVKVDVGSSQVSIAWAYADEALRLMTGQKPVKEQTATRVFTKDNIGGLNLTPGGYLSGTWYGPLTFESKYLKNWGVG